MPIQTSLQPRYVFKSVAITIVCLVLGLWGIYDYTVKIPDARRAVERHEVYTTVKPALELAATSGGRDANAAAALREAGQSVSAAIQALGITAESEDGRIDVPVDELFQKPFEPRNDEQWRNELLLFTVALREGTAWPGGGGDVPQLLAAGYELARARMNVTGTVKKPGTWDPFVQWMFILCLPFVPWFAWQILRLRGQVHRLDEDGSFHGSHGSWARDEIADVDMSRWMSKSLAEVVHGDGSRVKLDDYVHRNVDRIAGALATRFHPDDWDENARPRTHAGDDEGHGAGEEPSMAGEPVPHDDADMTDHAGR